MLEKISTNTAFLINALKWNSHEYRLFLAYHKVNLPNTNTHTHLALHHLDTVLPCNGRILRLLNEVPEHRQNNASHFLLHTLTQNVCQGWDDTVPVEEDCAHI